MLPSNGQSNESLEISRINTSGKGELCALFAITNCLLTRPPEERAQFYQRIDLDNDVATALYHSYMDIYGENYKKISALNSDNVTIEDILKWKQVQLGDEVLREELQIIKKRFDDPKTKDDFIEEYKSFLFNEDREVYKGYQNPLFSESHACPFTLDKFKELQEFYKTAQDSGKSFLQAMDEAPKFKFVGYETEGYQRYETQANGGTILISENKTIKLYQPNCFEIFLGLVMKNKWDGEWKKEFKQEMTAELRKLFGDLEPEQSLIEDLGHGADSHLSQESIGFLLDKVAPNLQLQDDIFKNPQNSRNKALISLTSQHYTAHALESEIQKEATSHSARAMMRSDVASGGETESSLPRATSEPVDIRSLCKTLLINPDINRVFCSLSANQTLDLGDLKFTKSEYGDNILRMGENELILNRSVAKISGNDVNGMDKEAVVNNFAIFKDYIIAESQKMPARSVSPRSAEQELLSRLQQLRSD
jgi:hypothetical protein